MCRCTSTWQINLIPFYYSIIDTNDIVVLDSYSLPAVYPLANSSTRISVIKVLFSEIQIIDYQ